MKTYKKNFYHGKIATINNGEKDEEIDQYEFEKELEKLISKFINVKGFKSAAYATIYIDIVHENK